MSSSGNLSQTHLDFFTQTLGFPDDQAHGQLDALVGKSSLKPAFWVYGGMPDLNTVTGTHYAEPMPMAIFEPSAPIEDEVKVNQLVTFPISIHDGLISGDVGHLNLEAKHLNASFWSLVISPRQKRAAVTLHWLLDQASYQAFLQILQTSGNDRLEKLILALENDPIFTTNSSKNNPHAHLLKQLKHLAGSN
jgi:hypothetical protein